VAGQRQPGPPGGSSSGFLEFDCQAVPTNVSLDAIYRVGARERIALTSIPPARDCATRNASSPIAVTY
jgi:hypothetical protein